MTSVSAIALRSVERNSVCLVGCVSLAIEQISARDIFWPASHLLPVEHDAHYKYVTRRTYQIKVSLMSDAKSIPRGFARPPDMKGLFKPAPFKARNFDKTFTP